MTEFSDLNLCPINNRQGIVIDGEGSRLFAKTNLIIQVCIFLKKMYDIKSSGGSNEIT